MGAADCINQDSCGIERQRREHIGHLTKTALVLSHKLLNGWPRVTRREMSE